MEEKNVLCISFLMTLVVVIPGTPPLLSVEAHQLQHQHMSNYTEDRTSKCNLFVYAIHIAISCAENNAEEFL